MRSSLLVGAKKYKNKIIRIKGDKKMNNQQIQQQDLSLENRVINQLCMRIANLEGNLAMANAENEILREELEMLRNKKD